jgi:hypothetical protein
MKNSIHMKIKTSLLIILLGILGFTAQAQTNQSKFEDALNWVEQTTVIVSITDSSDHFTVIPARGPVRELNQLPRFLKFLQESTKLRPVQTQKTSTGKEITFRNR